MSSGGGGSSRASNNNGSSNKRARTATTTDDDASSQHHRLRLNDTLFKKLGTRYCGNAEELLELLLEARLCAKVETFHVKVEKLGASHARDHLSVELDVGLSDQMAEVKRVIEKEEGVKPWEAQLYRSEEKWDGTYGSHEQQEAALLSNDQAFDGPCTLQLVSQDFEAGSESNITWTQVSGPGFSAEGSVLSNTGPDDGSAVSAETISHSANTVQGVSWTVATQHSRPYFIGLTSKDEVDESGDLDFALRVNDRGGFGVFEQGKFKETTSETGMFPNGWRTDMKCQAGDVLAVKVQGNQVLYTKNGKTLARSLVPPGFPLRAAAFFNGAYGEDVQGDQRAVDVQLQLAGQA